MLNTTTVTRIIATVNKGAAAPLMEEMHKAGLTSIHQNTARSSVLEQKKGVFGLAPSTRLAEDPVEMLSVLVAPESEQSTLHFIMEKAHLRQPGRGSVISETVDVVKAHDLFQPATVNGGEGERLLENLTAICCIVQRGQGEAVARVPLDLGASVPVATFGLGTGVRDKVGLLRIAIPAEKEVVYVTLTAEEAPAVMERMIEVGRLDLPGKGFIYVYPVGKGWLNTILTRGMQGHAASLDQVITAIDDLKGGTDWRRKAQAAEDHGPRRTYLENLLDITLYCKEGRGNDLVKAAMEVGVPGATISLMKHRCPTESPQNAISQAREACVMIIPKGNLDNVAQALEKAGAFNDDTHGLMVARPVPKAFTFLGK